MAISWTGRESSVDVARRRDVRKLERTSISMVEGRPRSLRTLRRAREARHLSSSQGEEKGGLGVMVS